MGLTRIRAEQISDIDYKQAVRVVATSNTTLSGGTPNQIDGVNLIVGDRILVTGQNTASQNGIYVVQTVGSGSDGTWVRSSDANATGEIDAGMIIMVTEGAQYADTQWKLTTNNPIVVGTTELTFILNALSIVGGSTTQIQYNSGGVLAGSANLSWSGTELFVGGTANVTGNITGSNVTVSGSVLGNGRPLTSLNAANLDTGTVSSDRLSGTYVINVTGSAATAVTAATVTTAAQPNITSVGTLTSLLVTGNVSGGNLTSLGEVSGVTLTGTLSTAAQPNITSVGTLTSLAVAGVTTLTNPLNITQTSGNNDSQIYVRKPNQSAFSVLAWDGLTYISNNLYYSDGGWVQQSPSGDTTNSLIAIDGDGLSWYASDNGTTSLWNVANGVKFLNANGTINTAEITKSGSNGVGNIGSVSNSFNTVFARATSAQYADLAERYLADRQYLPGTVLIFGGEKEVTVSFLDHDERVAGVVSTDPAYIMNAGLDHEHSVAVALMGRVPCRVFGKVSKGECVATSCIPGVARALDRTRYLPGCIIGKALTDHDGDGEGMIEVVVGRL